jgi:hypothetical protein
MSKQTFTHGTRTITYEWHGHETVGVAYVPAPDGVEVVTLQAGALVVDKIPEPYHSTVRALHAFLFGGPLPSAERS